MSLRRYFGVVRGLLLLVGIALFVVGLDAVASTSPSPPESDGFVEGLAYIFALISGVSGLVVAQIGYALPAGTGRFRVGPLADRGAGVRSGAVVVLYLLIAIVMVYGIPVIVPSVTESMTYVTALFVFAIAAVVGAVVTGIAALSDMLLELYRRHRGSDESSTSM
jgi:hypothetical protein